MENTVLTMLHSPLEARASLVALACGLLLASSCTREASGDRARGEAPAGGERSALRAEAPGLEHLRTFEPDLSGFLVTPRWAPAGDRLIASGHGGRGLYLLELGDGEVRELDRRVKAGRRLEFRPDGRALAASVPATEGFLVIDLRQDVTVAPSSERPAFVPPRERLSDGEGDAEVLWRSGDERVVFEPLRGRLALISGEGERVLAPEGAWSAAVSPDGRRVAYCLGHLIEAQLHLYTRGEGARELGPGAHPSWHPDGRHLVFTVPETDVSGGRPELVGAELFVVDVESGGDVQLTSTPDESEMEPAVSPRGDLVAFSDWRSGRLTVARLNLGRGEGRQP